MSRFRIGTLGLTMLFLVSTGGCARHASTRVFLHGDVVDEDEHSIAGAVVRQEKIETLSDDKGHYRMLFLVRCLRGGVGPQGVQTKTLEAYAPGFKKTEMGYLLDAIEMIGTGSCPRDTDKFLRLVMLKSKPSQ